MSVLRRALLLGLALCASASLAQADQISDLNNQLELIKLKITVATKQKDYIALQTDAAKAEKDIAEALQAAAEARLAAAKADLAKVPPPIEMASGSLYVIGDTQRSCNALPFLRWQCNGADTCPVFTVDDKICGLPGATTEPMELSLAYQCGNQTIKDVIPFNRPAHLTCK